MVDEAPRARIALGIDTGGTYTDAVLADRGAGTDAVLAAAKALTTRHDLSLGISEAVNAVFEQGAALGGGRTVSASDVELVGLSTTLATNALVEGRGHPVCLLLIGYDPALLRHFDLDRNLVTDDVVHVTGGHDGGGEEVAPLDLAAVREAVLAHRDRVEGFAVSGYFGVRNPDHELRARELILSLTDTKVTCAHELTGRLDAVRRATTVALNARLVPLLRELIATVRLSLRQLGVSAPLMIVKGDGSLVRVEWALHRPIETVLSGPAASVVGASRLAGRGDVWTVDMGGTTTDIAVLRDGLPRLNPDGARIGDWQPMIATVDVHTAGLGGDSHVQLDGGGNGGLTIGPRRVVPLSLLAREHDGVVTALRRQLTMVDYQELTGQFVLRQAAGGSDSGEEGDALVNQLDSPRTLIWLRGNSPSGSLVLREVARLESRQLILRSAFTPTDALHVLGRFHAWDVEAARLGAELLAARAGQSVEAFCEGVVAAVSERLTGEIVTKVLADEADCPDWWSAPSAAALVTRALGRIPESDLACRLSLQRPIVAVGAPVEAYLPLSARHLHTELVIPPNADVGNALGAVVAGVVQQVRVVVRPPDEIGGPFRLHLPQGVYRSASIDDAVGYARKVVPDYLRDLMRQAGADGVDIRESRQDVTAPLDTGWGEAAYVETELVFTAMGDPDLS